MKKPLRILVAHNLRRQRTGGGSRLMGFVHDELEKAGHTVDYLCADDVGAPARGPWGRFLFPLEVVRCCAAAVRAGRRYDIVNVHEPSSAAIATFRNACARPVVVATSHGVEQRGWEISLNAERLGITRPGLKTRLVYPMSSLWQSRVGLRRADHVFCLSSEDREFLIRRFGIAAHRITRVYSAASELYRDAASGRDYAVADRLLFAGTWLERKGIRDLVAGFSALADAHPGLTLTVLGAGVSSSFVLEAFPEGVRARVSCLQTARESETAAAFAAADLFVLPSLFEATPLTLMEAMMSGLPIVTTATCGMKDVIRDGDNGLLIPVHSPEAILNALDRLICDHALRERLGRAAQADALGKYTWGRVAKPVIETYERLCEARW